MSRTLHIAALLTLLSVSGCSSKPSVSEYQCLAGDWQTIGYRDGSQGRSRSDLLRHTEACGEYNVVPDRESYMVGWRQGISEYCTVENGFYQGERGAGLNTECSTPDYRQAHRQGRDLYLARREVSQLQSALASAEQRLSTIDEDILQATAAQVSPTLTVQERVALAADVKSLVEERARLREELPAMEYELAQSEARLAELETQPDLLSARR